MVLGLSLTAPPVAAQAPPGLATSAAARPVVSVEIQPAQKGRAERLYRTVGEIVAIDSVQITTQTPGIIQRLMFDEGSAVEAGAPLVQLDDRTAQAALRNAASQRDLAHQTAVRTRDLASHGLNPAASLERDNAAMVAAEAHFQSRSIEVETLTLRAPFAGTLTDRQVSVGAFLNPGQPVATLQNLDRLRLRFRLPQRLVPETRAGQAVRVEINLAPGRMVETRVSLVEPVVDEATRLVRVLAEIDNRERLFRPGSFARIALVLSVTEEAVLVPAEAVVQSLAGPYVFAVADGVARRVAVTLGERRDGLVEIRSGLAVGTPVVTQGQFKIEDGSPVRATTAATAANRGGS